MEERPLAPALGGFDDLEMFKRGGIDQKTVGRLPVPDRRTCARSAF